MKLCYSGDWVFVLTWVIPSLDVVAVIPREPYIAGYEGRDVKCDIALVLVSRLIPFGSHFVHVHTRRRGAQITVKELEALKIVSQPDVPSLGLLVEACESLQPVPPRRETGMRAVTLVKEGMIWSTGIWPS